MLYQYVYYHTHLLLRVRADMRGKFNNNFNKLVFFHPENLFSFIKFFIFEARALHLFY